MSNEHTAATADKALATLRDRIHDYHRACHAVMDADEARAYDETTDSDVTEALETAADKAADAIEAAEDLLELLAEGAVPTTWATPEPADTPALSE